MNVILLPLCGSQKLGNRHFPDGSRSCPTCICTTLALAKYLYSCAAVDYKQWVPIGWCGEQDLGATQTQSFPSHAHALQSFSNGAGVPYSSTLRVVVHEGDRGSGPMTDTRKAPGYIRNELGGMFTSWDRHSRANWERCMCSSWMFLCTGILLTTLVP